MKPNHTKNSNYNDELYYHPQMTIMTLMQKLRLVNDFDPGMSKVAAQAFGQVMSTFVVQEHYIWLNTVGMKEAEKARSSKGVYLPPLRRTFTQ